MANINAPITGSVWRILVAVGDHVSQGDVVAIIESMKLEIPVESETSGTVREICVAVGDSLAEDDSLIVLD